MAAIPARWRNWSSCRQTNAKRMNGVVGPSEQVGEWPRRMVLISSTTRRDDDGYKRQRSNRRSFDGISLGDDSIVPTKPLHPLGNCSRRLLLVLRHLSRREGQLLIAEGPRPMWGRHSCPPSCLLSDWPVTVERAFRPAFRPTRNWALAPEVQTVFVPCSTHCHSHPPQTARRMGILCLD